jgi:hypothetical protein
MPGVTPVVVVATASAPEVLENDTVAPGTTTLLEFLTMAVIVAGVDPADGICGAVLTSVMSAAVAVGPPLLLLPLLLELAPAKELAWSPPQPAMTSVAARVPRNQPYLRIVFT